MNVDVIDAKEEKEIHCQLTNNDNYEKYYSNVPATVQSEEENCIKECHTKCTICWTEDDCVPLCQQGKDNQIEGFAPVECAKPFYFCNADLTVNKLEVEVDWKNELENYKESESERREEDRLYFQSKLAELEASARDQSYDQERQAMLKQDSIRLQALNEEIQNLKSFLGAANVASFNDMGDEKLAMLDQAQAELDRQSGRGGSGTGMIVLISVLSALVIGLIVVLVFMLINKPKQQMPPPWMMYPPRRPKKKDSGAPAVTNVVQAPSQPAQQSSTPNEDIAVLQSEVNDMKQAVVSMSVGQPQAANKIVKDWIVEEAPAEPEPEPSDDDGDDGDDKKKKKK